MDKYIIKYQKSTGNLNDIHPSWYELCEKQTKDIIVKILKKHLFDEGEYTFCFYAHNGKISQKHNQKFFKGCIVGKDDRFSSGQICYGFIELDYFDDTFDDCDFKNTYPYIECEKELTNPTAHFMVSGDDIISPKELEIMRKKSAERFIKRLHNSVSFPLEIACDYPDVIFEICYDCEIDENLVADTLKVVEDYVKKYNKRHDEGIHYVDKVCDAVDDKKSNAIYIHIDFGECDINALALLIKAIGKSKLPIKEMILR